MNVGEIISKAIKEGKWINISYHQSDGNTTFWIAVLDIADNKKRKLKVSMFNDAKSLNALDVEIYFDKIPNTSWQIKGNVVKKTYSIPKVKALSVSTKLTNPCDSCKLGVRMYSDSDWFALGSQLKLGQEINFIGHDGSQNPGKYQLGATRTDFTLLNTKATLKWTYD